MEEDEEEGEKEGEEEKEEKMGGIIIIIIKMKNRKRSQYCQTFRFIKILPFPHTRPPS